MPIVDIYNTIPFAKAYIWMFGLESFSKLVASPSSR